MSCYIRRRTEGATYFFTIRIADRGSTILTAHIDHLRRATRHTLARHPFKIEAITVLPSVIHTIWTLPQGDSDFPNRIGMLKSTFSKGLPDVPNRTAAQIKRGEKGIWQRRYWEHQIRDQADFERHRNMIYLSPVHAGLCPAPQDWAHSSLHRDLKHGHDAPIAIGHGAAKLHLTPRSALQQRYTEGPVH